MLSTPSPRRFVSASDRLRRLPPCLDLGKVAGHTDSLAVELKQWVGNEISPIARPDIIQFAPGLPKTRSGKIMRRILRKIGEGDISNLGDTSTLADPGVVDDLVKNARRN